jgi:hypothetical protein
MYFSYLIDSGHGILCQGGPTANIAKEKNRPVSIPFIYGPLGNLRVGKIDFFIYKVMLSLNSAPDQPDTSKERSEYADLICTRPWSQDFCNNYVK